MIKRIILLGILVVSCIGVVGAPTPIPLHADYWGELNNLTNVSTNMSMPQLAENLTTMYVQRLGTLFWVFLFFPPFLTMWIIQKNVIIPVILALIVSPILFLWLPVQFQSAAYVFFTLSLTGVVVMWWKETR